MPETAASAFDRVGPTNLSKVLVACNRASDTI